MVNPTGKRPDRQPTPRHLGGVNPDLGVIIRRGEEEAEVCDVGKGRRGKPSTICVLRNGGSYRPHYSLKEDIMLLMLHVEDFLATGGLIS